MTIKKQTVLPDGVTIRKCPPRKAKGLEPQRMRASTRDKVVRIVGADPEPFNPCIDVRAARYVQDAFEAFEDTALDIQEIGGEG